MLNIDQDERPKNRAELWLIEFNLNQFITIAYNINTHDMWNKYQDQRQ